MKNLYSFLSLAMLLLFSATVSAQVLMPENFEGTTAQSPVPPGWSFVSSPPAESTTINPCEGNRSVRLLISSTNQSATLRSPMQVATGDDITVSFDYKLVNQTGGGATPVGFGSFDLQYTLDADAKTPTWTNYALIDGTNHTPSTSCVTHTATIPAASVPAGSEFAWRVRASWTSGSYHIYIDDFLAVEEVACIAPIYVKVSGVTFDEAVVSWTDLNNASEWNIEYGPLNFPPGFGFGTIVNSTTNPTTLVNLDDGTEYDVYVSAVCSTTAESDYAGPVTFQTIAIGTDCNTPMEIAALPFTHSDNTTKFGNSYSGSPGNGCVGNNFLQGFDVVYEYTSTIDDYLNFDLSNLVGADNVGLFVYESCASIGTSCYAGGTTTTGDDFNFDVFVAANQTYYFVLSTAGANSSTDFTLNINGFDCLSFGVPSGPSNIEFFGQDLGAFDNTRLGIEPTNDFATLKWYTDNNGVPGTAITNTSTVSLTNGDVFHVNQVLGTCDSAYLMVTFTEFDCLGQLAVLTTDSGDEICHEGTTTLGATAATDNLFWYANEFGGDPIGTGQDFTTPTISQTTSYWVGEAFIGEGNLSGQANPGPSTVASSTANNYGVLINNISSDFTLVNVQVFSTAGGGAVTIDLVDINGASATQTTTASIPAGSAASPKSQIITLNFELKSGSSYRLLKTSGPGMLYSTAANSSFPYAVGNVAEVTSGSTLSGTTTSYYYFYNWTVTEELPLCESPRLEVVATVNEVFNVVPSTTSSTVCVGQNADLNVTSADTDYIYTWTWTNPSGVPQTATGASIQPTILQNTTFSVTGYNPITDCTSPEESIAIEAIGAGEILVTPVAVNTCVGEVIELFAGGEFNHFENLNTGWTTVNNSTGPKNPAGAGWKLVNSPHNPTGGLRSNDDSQFYISISDEVGPGGNVNTQLISPSMNLVGVQNATLTFFHHYDYISTQATTARVQVSEGQGAWTTLRTFTSTQGTPTQFAKETINLNAYTGSADVRVRFEYTGKWAWWWAIDNVDIIKDYTNGQITWASQDHLFLDVDATVPYTGTPTNRVYFKSDVPGTFTYNIDLDIAGCANPVTNTVVVTVSDSPIPTGDAVQSYVAGQTLATLDVTGQNLRYYILENGVYKQLSPNFLLRHGTTYYITQTINGCESDYLEVTVDLDCPAPSDVVVNTEVGTNGTTAAIIVTWTPPTNTTSIQNYAIEIKNALGDVVFQGTAPATSNYRVIQGLALDDDFVLEIYSVCDRDAMVYSDSETVAFSTQGLSTDDFSFAGFTYYPNPTKDMVSFRNSLPMKNIEVFSINGQKVFELNNINKTEVTVDFSEMATGVYFSVVTVGDSVQVVRIIRE